MYLSSLLAEAPEDIQGIVVTYNEKEYFVHTHVFYSFVVVIILCVFFGILASKVKKANPREKSTGLVLIAEIIYKGVLSLTKDSVGEKRIQLAPYALSLAAFILLSNISGLIGFTPPTADYNVTFTLALITAILIHYFAIKSGGLKGHIKSYIEPVPFLLPLNLLDIVIVPVSMSLRLFGNILAGSLLIGLVYSVLGYFAPLVTPVLHGYFDLFAGGLQTLVFVLLTMTFIGKDESEETI